MFLHSSVNKKTVTYVYKILMLLTTMIQLNICHNIVKAVLSILDHFEVFHQGFYRFLEPSLCVC